MPETPPVEPEPVYETGPFESTEVKTIEISGPFKITLTTKYNSSHVPPSTSTVETTGPDLFETLKPLAEIIIAKLDEIKRGQRANAPD
jgi:hypothetical protein